MECRPANLTPTARRARLAEVRRETDPMCDTMVALGAATRDGVTLFGKNSDREPDEAQNVEIVPAARHAAGATVDCTYLTIPQVEETFRVLLCRPFWMFGAEMGANEHGVVIGNEALFTREKPDDTGLLGMDLLRLGLERGRTARAALDVIIRLLEAHGQGGKAGYRQNLKYMNSFIIADAREAYVLETVKRWWAWKKIEDVWTISNVISLENDFDEASPGLIENAVRKRWCTRASDFNFRKCYSDRVFTWGARGRTRQARSRELLLRKKGALTAGDVMAALRDHGSDGEGAARPPAKVTVCMHAANKLTRPTASTCSLVASLGQGPGHFYTIGAANPCLSPFFPVFAGDTAMPAGYRPGGERYDASAFWWRSERYHRRAVLEFTSALGAITGRMSGYEREMIEKIESAPGPPGQETIDAAFEQARGIVEEWGEKLGRGGGGDAPWLLRRYWRKYNRLNGVA